MLYGRLKAFLIASNARLTVTLGLGVASYSLLTTEELLAVTEVVLLEKRLSCKSVAVEVRNAGRCANASIKVLYYAIVGLRCLFYALLY
jgi:hypothetical protein